MNIGKFSVKRPVTIAMASLVLILFAGLTQNNYAKELAESQGIQKNLVEVTARYQTLSDSMKVLNKELESAQATIETYEKDIAAKANQILVTDTLIKAMELYDNGNVELAKEKIANLSADDLTDTQLYMYNRINK